MIGTAGLDEVIERTSARVEVRSAGYERWRAATRAGARALVERWPGSSAAAAAAAAAVRWLDGRAGTSRLVFHHDDLVVLADVGRPAHTLAADDLAGVVGRAMGTALADLHAVPVAACPSTLLRHELLELAARRVATRDVDPSRLGAAYARFRPEQLLSLAAASAPAHDGQPVVSHGDCVVANLQVDRHGRPSGWVRLDRLAVSDRHRDIARALKDLVARFGAPAADAFLVAYGTGPDLLTLEFHTLLDELLP